MEHLNYKVLSLKDMAIRRLISVLFKESDILESVRNFRRESKFWNDDSIKVWKETVEDKMVEKILKLGLPQSLTKLVVDTIKPMVRQVPGWKEIHEEYLYFWKLFDVPILERLCWTAAGALDYRKTAEELIRSDVMDTQRRYQLACLYCLEDYIPLLWRELPEEIKRCFYNGNRYLEGSELRLQFCWPYIIRGEQSKLDYVTRSYRRDPISFHQFAFQESAKMPNKAAAEYFFQKLTQEEKEASLIPTAKALLSSRRSRGDLEKGISAPKEKVSEVLHYLLSVMTPDQQMRIFQEESCLVLKCFVDWPLQDLFSEIADLVWNFLPESSHGVVMWDMYTSYANSGHYFQALFHSLFLRIPCHRREIFVHHYGFFRHVLKREDKEALETIFRSVDAAVRKALVFSEDFLSGSRSSIPRGRWDVVEVCLRETRLSKEDRARLKDAFMAHLKRAVGAKAELGKWARFFQLLDETDAPSKRCSEDETPTEAKRKET